METLNGYYIELDNAAKNTILQVDGSYDNDLMKTGHRTSNPVQPLGGHARSSQPLGGQARSSNLAQPPVPRKYSAQISRPSSLSSKNYLQVNIFFFFKYQEKFYYI